MLLLFMEEEIVDGEEFSVLWGTFSSQSSISSFFDDKFSLLNTDSAKCKFVMQQKANVFCVSGLPTNIVIRTWKNIFRRSVPEFQIYLKIVNMWCSISFILIMAIDY